MVKLRNYSLKNDIYVDAKVKDNMLDTVIVKQWHIRPYGSSILLSLGTIL